MSKIEVSDGLVSPESVREGSIPGLTYGWPSSHLDGAFRARLHVCVCVCVCVSKVPLFTRTLVILD